MNLQRAQAADPDQPDAVQIAPFFGLPGVHIAFQRNEEVFGEGEPADYIYQVKSGAVRTVRFSSDGRRQILAFHLPGDIFGLEFGAAHGFSAEAVACTDIILVRRSELESTAGQNRDAARALLHITQRTLQEAREHALLLARKGASNRVAAFLLQLGQRFVNNQELDLPMSRADIGDYLGLTIESVSRAFSDMKQRRTIALPSSRRVVMRDRHALPLPEAA